MKIPPDWQFTIVETNPLTPLADLREKIENPAFVLYLPHPLQTLRVLM